MHHYEEELTLYEFMRDLFKAAAITCALWSMHRFARGVILSGQVRALDEFEDAYAPEERELLIHRIKAQSLRF